MTAVAMLALLTSLGCDRRTETTSPDNTSAKPSLTAFEFNTISEPPISQPSPFSSGVLVHFEEVADSLALRHRYDNGASPLRLMVEATGGGVGWLDFDGDGLLDAYFTQGGAPNGQASDRPADQLFRSRFPDGFEPVTPFANLGDREYSQGVAVGDFDNDGFADIFVTNVGPDVLYRNLGDGTFEDVTASAGVADRLWSSSAAWGDLDLDGDLDLYVCHYLKYDPHHPLPCPNKNGEPAVCHPRDVEPSPDECFENLGDGSFRPIAKAKGLFGAGNKGLGVAIADFNNDGLPDVYVANDTTANFLFLNQREKGFRESALTEGCALSGSGAAQASMGVAVADFDHNGFLDLYLTHFTMEHNTLYRNLGSQGFVDVSPETGMRALTLSTLGFGTAMCDFNQDGLMDAFCSNGHIDILNDDQDVYEMQPLLLLFDGTRWHDGSAKAGAYYQHAYVGRGTATGDFDNDGDVDLLVGHQNSNAALLRNDSVRGHWLKLRLLGRVDNRDAVGARVTVIGQQLTRMQERVGGTSYASAHDPALIFGMGTDAGPYSIEIRWPNGEQQKLSVPSSGQSLVVVQPTVSEGDAR